jgi:hypothetical protein
MIVFKVLEIASWAVSFILAVWMIVNLLRTNARYSEEVLMSSREGEIEDELIIDPTHRGPA